MEIYFFTHNKSKFVEAEALAKEYNITISWKNVEYEEIQANTIEEIASVSCKRLIQSNQENRKLNFFVEDAGLFIERLNGFPGPYSAYVFHTIGNEGILNLMSNQNEREAYFKSVIAFYDGKNIKNFIGKTEGKIIDQIKGKGGFGFDPIFQPKGIGDTFAQMSLQTKNLYSHRQKSLRDLFASLTAFDKNRKSGE